MKHSKRLAAIALAAAFSLGGCATLINGTHENVPIEVSPAGASIQLDGNQYLPPFDASLSRDRGYQVIASKSGYQTQTMEIHSSFSGWTVLNLFFWPGWIIDLADGSAYKLEPRSVQMILQPTNNQVGLNLNR